MNNQQFTASVRKNQSFLAQLEKQFIAYLIPKIPRGVSPLHLTVLGLVGAVVVAVGLIAAHQSPYFLLVTFFGLALNWFGDSLDGSLARFRSIERPRFGFLVDHASDLLAQVIMLVGFGLSPCLTMISALIILCMYLLFAGYTYVRVSVERIHQMSYGGMGATEFRIMMGVWAVIGYCYADTLFAPIFGAYTLMDIIIASLSLGAFVLLINALILDATRVAAEEGVGGATQRDGGVIALNVHKAKKSV